MPLIMLIILPCRRDAATPHTLPLPIAAVAAIRHFRYAADTPPVAAAITATC